MILVQALRPVLRATMPAAAVMPAWRHAPPNRICRRLASGISAEGPHRSDPIGAPRPFETQNMTVSASLCECLGIDPRGRCRVEQAGLRRGAPARLASSATFRTARSSSTGTTRPPRTDGVLHRQQVDDLDVVVRVGFQQRTSVVGVDPPARARIGRSERDTRQRRRSHDLGAGDVRRGGAGHEVPADAPAARARSGWPWCPSARRGPPPCRGVPRRAPADGSRSGRRRTRHHRPPQRPSRRASRPTACSRYPNAGRRGTGSRGSV